MLLRISDSDVERLFILGVRALYRREVSVRLSLLFYDIEILNARLRKHTLNRHSSRAVKRGVYNPKVTHILSKRLSSDSLNVLVVYCLAYRNIFSFGKRNLGCRRDGTNLFEYSCRRIRRNLSSVLSVRLISVIFFGVVTCCDYYSSDTSEVTHSKGKFGRRTKALEKIRLYIASRKHSSRFFSKFCGIVSRIVRDYYSAGDILSASKQILGKTVGCSAYRIYVHTVSSRSHNSAQTASAELKFGKETVLESLVIHFSYFALSILVDKG